MSRNSLLYHGGGYPRATFAQGIGSAKSVFSYAFGIEGNSPVNAFLEPPSDGGTYGTGTGYSTSRELSYLSMDTLIHEYRTNDESSQLQLALRYIPNTGGPTPLTLATQGTLIARKVYILPNTLNVTHYNLGGLGISFASLPASSVLFCVIEIQTALFLHGITCLARFTE